MITKRGVLGFLAVGWVALTGCHKAEQPAARPTGYFGVTVELDRLDVEFTNASPELHRSVSLVKRYYAYSEFPRAAAELDQLAGDPSLSEPQKKLVADLIEQTAQVIAQAPPAPAQ